MATKAFQKIYTKITQINKATCTLRATGIGNDELATVNGALAQVVKIRGDEVTLQVFGGTEGIPTNAEVIFLGKAPSLKVSDQLAGRFFNSYGEPIDGGPAVEGEEREIGGPSVNPVRRKQPSELIATSIAGIDLNNTLVSGQKIPFFADPDQPYNQVMANVALRAQADKIVLGGMGLTNDDYLYFKNVFSNAGVLDRIVSFVNTTENPPVERLLIPDMALTAAEYFAVDKNEKVLVLLTDMTSYADALAIVSNRMDQIPSKDSMPGSLYSDLAKIYEKAVQFPEGGSITIIAVTTLSGGDITHAVPDNTGYITEGQLYLRRDSDIGKVIIDPFRSLSRLKQLVTGKKTREDHPQVMNAAVRLYSDAANAKTKLENGFDLTDYDERTLAFAKEYLTDGYACIYKYKGVDQNEKKMEKPEISPIEMNRDKTSDFVAEVRNSKVEPIEPVFVDFNKEIEHRKFKNGTEMLYKHNDVNGLFSVCYIFDRGSKTDKTLPFASDLLDYLGTSKMSAEELQTEFYKLACTMNINVLEDKTYVSVSGLAENMEKALALCEEAVLKAEPDDKAYEDYVANVLKMRADNKLNQETNFRQLVMWGKYGSVNESTNILSETELKSTDAKTLLESLRNLWNCSQTITYYGPEKAGDAERIIAGKHKMAKKPVAPEADREYMPLRTDSSEIYIAPYKAKNIYLMMFSNKGVKYDPEYLPGGKRLRSVPVYLAQPRIVLRGGDTGPPYHDEPEPAGGKRP